MKLKMLVTFFNIGAVIYQLYGDLMHATLHTIKSDPPIFDGSLFVHINRNYLINNIDFLSSQSASIEPLASFFDEEERNWNNSQEDPIRWGEWAGVKEFL